MSHLNSSKCCKNLQIWILKYWWDAAVQFCTCICLAREARVDYLVWRVRMKLKIDVCNGSTKATHSLEFATINMKTPDTAECLRFADVGNRFPSARELPAYFPLSRRPLREDQSNILFNQHWVSTFFVCVTLLSISFPRFDSTPSLGWSY